MGLAPFLGRLVPCPLPLAAPHVFPPVGRVPSPVAPPPATRRTNGRQADGLRVVRTPAPLAKVAVRPMVAPPRLAPTDGGRPRQGPAGRPVLVVAETRRLPTAAEAGALGTGLRGTEVLDVPPVTVWRLAPLRVPETAPALRPPTVAGEGPSPPSGLGPAGLALSVRVRPPHGGLVRLQATHAAPALAGRGPTVAARTRPGPGTWPRHRPRKTPPSLSLMVASD